jgi:hypothetical protein
MKKIGIGMGKRCEYSMDGAVFIVGGAETLEVCGLLLGLY